MHAEHERLSALGVAFTQPPTEMGPVTTAVLDDTCGNLIQIAAVSGLVVERVNVSVLL